MLVYSEFIRLVYKPNKLGTGDLCKSIFNCTRKFSDSLKFAPVPRSFQSSFHQQGRQYTFIFESGGYTEITLSPHFWHLFLYSDFSFLQASRLTSLHSGQNVGGGTFIFS